MKKTYLMEKPKRRKRDKTAIYEDLEQFSKRKELVMKIDWREDYSRVESCRGVYHKAIARYGFRMKVEQINNEVYISKLEV